MKFYATALCLLMLIVCTAAQAPAVSVSSADTYFDSYGQARHFEQHNEFLGDIGDIYDGVVFSAFIPGEMATITVRSTVGALFGTGDFEYLSLWIDWDQSRQWEMDEEIINIDDTWFDPGTNELQFQVATPDDAVLGSTWMRTRFSFDGDLTAAGDFHTGEVEDYEIQVGVTDPIPEPSALLLFATGLLCCGAGLAGRVRPIG